MSSASGTARRCARTSTCSSGCSTPASFEFDRPMTGMEIELNLVDADYQPHFANAEVLRGDRRPGATRPSWRSTTSSSTCRPRPLPGDSALELEEELRTSLNAAERARPRRSARRSSPIGILPTIMPEHFEGEWISANNRYTALNDSIFVARGEDIYLDIEGPTGERVATYCDSIAPESACTSRPAAPAGRPQRTSPRTGTPRRPSSRRSWRWRRTRPFFFGKRLHAETRIELFTQATDTRPHRAEEPGGPARASSSASGGSPRSSTCSRRTSATSRPCSPRSATRTRWRCSRPARPRSLAELRLHNGTVYRWNRPIYDIVERHPAPARREPRAAGRPDHRRRPGQRRVLLRRDPDAGARGPPGLDQDELRRVPSRTSGEPPATASTPGCTGRGSASCRPTSWCCATCSRWPTRACTDWGVSTAVRDRYLVVIEGRCKAGVNGADVADPSGAAASRPSGSDRREALRRMLELYAEHMDSNEPVHTWPLP